MRFVGKGSWSIWNLALVIFLTALTLSVLTKVHAEVVAIKVLLARLACLIDT